MPEINISNITPPRVPFLEIGTDYISREWYRWFINMFARMGNNEDDVLAALQAPVAQVPTADSTLTDVSPVVSPALLDLDARISDAFKTPSTVTLPSAITVLSKDVTTQSSAAYTTVFVIPISAGQGNMISVRLIAESDTAGVAVQVRARGSVAQVNGTASWLTPTGAAATTIVNTQVTTTAADTAETTLFAANQAFPIVGEIAIMDTSSADQLYIEVQSETGATAVMTIRAGSYYIKTPIG